MSREIRPLTGVRGVAACWVVLCHWTAGELTGWGRDIALHGYAAVDLFMILSGFVLALTYVPRMGAGLWTGFGGFVWQRFCRLYPLYAVTTLVCLVELWRQGEAGIAAGAIASNLLMTTTHLWEVDAFNGPSWSISVEFTLNLFFPLFVLLCCRLAWRWSAGLAVACFAALVAVTVLDHRVNGGAAGGLGTLDTRLMYLRCGPEFALGMLCWRLRERAAWAAMFGRTLPLGLVVVAMLAMTPFKALDLPFVAACCVLVIGLSVERSWLAAWFGSGIPHWLGTISFSLYLWHAAFLPLRPVLLRGLDAAGVVDPMVALMAANTINFAAVLAVATLSYRHFEIPARRWLRSLVAPRVSPAPVVHR